MEPKKVYILDYLNALEADILGALSFPIHSTDVDYITKILFYRNLKISKDIVYLLQQRSFYNSCILLSSLIENCLLTFYFNIYPEEAIKYKEFATIEDLDRYRYWERKLKKLNLSIQEKENFLKDKDIWSGVPQNIQENILDFCKNNYKKYQRKNRKFTSDEDFLCRENYVKYIIPKFEKIFDSLIEYHSNNIYKQNIWIKLKINYEDACKFKHMNSNEIMTQFNYMDFFCIPNEKNSNLTFCFDTLKMINFLLLELVVPKYILETTYKKFEDSLITLKPVHAGDE